MASKDKEQKPAPKGDKGDKAAAQKPAPKAEKPSREAKDSKDAAPKGEKGAKAAKAAKPEAPAGPPRLQTHYRETVVPALIKKFGYKSAMQVPRISKITLNMGVGEAVADKKIMDNAVGDLAKIAGQKPVVTKSRKSIATFKI